MLMAKQDLELSLLILFEIDLDKNLDIVISKSINIFRIIFG